MQSLTSLDTHVEIIQIKSEPKQQIKAKENKKLMIGKLTEDDIAKSKIAVLKTFI